MLSRCFHCARLESMYWTSFWGTSSISVYTSSQLGALLQFQYYFYSIHQTYRSHIDSLLFIGIDSTEFHSMGHIQFQQHTFQEVTSSKGATGVIPMLSLCKTWIDVLNFSIHFWGTSSFSVPQLWRDSLLFMWIIEIQSTFQGLE